MSLSVSVILFFYFQNASITHRLYMAIDCLLDNKSKKAVRYYVLCANTEAQRKVYRETNCPTHTFQQQYTMCVHL